MEKTCPGVPVARSRFRSFATVSAVVIAGPAVPSVMATAVVAENNHHEMNKKLSNI